MKKNIKRFYYIKMKIGGMKKIPQSLNFKLAKVFVANRTEVITILYRKLLWTNEEKDEFQHERKFTKDINSSEKNKNDYFKK